MEVFHRGDTRLKCYLYFGDRRGYSSLLVDSSFSKLDLGKIRVLAGLGLAELLGTASFMALGCGNVVSNLAGADTSHLSTVLSFAFGIATSIAMFGQVSGALMNPALNLCAVILGHMSLVKFAFYTVFQLLGATIGVGFIKAVTPGELGEGFCVPQPGPGVSLAAAFAVELWNTAFLSFLLCSVLDPRNKPHAGSIYIKFGVGVTAIAIPTAKYAGCSMNPARAFGPALLSSLWAHHWVYWVAPLLGAAIASVVYRVFFDHEIAAAVEASPKREESQPV